MRQEKAILAGGCHWGLPRVDPSANRSHLDSRRIFGRESPNPSDDNPADHAEAVEVVFDADTLSYRDLLEFFFQVHDPTTLNQQVDEVGSYVRSAVFYTKEEHRRTAVDTIADVDASGLWPGKVVTEVTAAGTFWGAGVDDRDYLQKYPDGATCRFVRPGWKLPRRPDSPA